MCPTAGKKMCKSFYSRPFSSIVPTIHAAVEVKAAVSKSQVLSSPL